MSAGKQKTRKGVAKRVEVKKNRIMRQKAACRHRLVPKSSKAKGLAKMRHTLASGDAKNARKALHI